MSTGSSGCCWTRHGIGREMGSWSICISWIAAFVEAAVAHFRLAWLLLLLPGMELFASTENEKKCTINKPHLYCVSEVTLKLTSTSLPYLSQRAKISPVPVSKGPGDSRGPLESQALNVQSIFHQSSPVESPTPSKFRQAELHPPTQARSLANERPAHSLHSLSTFQSVI